ncbi:unnamed protein product [Heterobilharzia americana]|nr:unnamed protein product [Heterobilharzia americana]
MRESSRTRWDPARSTEIRRRDNSGHAHTAPLLQKVWKEEKVPGDWKKGYLVKLSKKGDLSVCKNWRGITLLSTHSKQNIRPHHPGEAKWMHWIQNYDQNTLAGFRKYKSCVDQIATLRIVIEQSIEWQSTLYVNFIDFEKAFDSVDREVIWKLLHYYGVPQTFIRLIQQLYEDATCQVIHNGKLSDAFEVK